MANKIYGDFLTEAIRSTIKCNYMECKYETGCFYLHDDSNNQFLKLMSHKNNITEVLNIFRNFILRAKDLDAVYVYQLVSW